MKTEIHKLHFLCNNIYMKNYFYAINKKIVSDTYNSLIFNKNRKREVYLVGGYIRDTLLGITSHDRDFIVSGHLNSFVNEIQKRIGGTVVKFKTEDTLRIAFKKGAALDFSKPQGTLEQDLSKRDFTINAIAWSPERGIIDQYNGLKDLQKKRIRAISKENFISDPLRILRAYRFAAEFKGSIDPITRKTIKLLHNKMKRVSPERITLELFNLLNSYHSAKYLKAALIDGILTEILSIPHNVLEHNIRAISKLERALQNRNALKIKVLLKKIFSQNLTYKGLLCMEILFLGSIDTKRMRISNVITKRIELSHKGIMALRERRLAIEDRLFDIFMDSREASLDILIIKGRLDLLKEYQRFKRIWKNGFLSSENIIKISRINPGPELGNVILKLKKAQFEKRVKSEKQAIQFLLSQP